MQSVFHRRFFIRVANFPVAFAGLLALALLLFTPSYAEAPGLAGIEGLEETEIPKPEANQPRTLEIIRFFVQRSHYRKRAVDNEFSSEVFQNYLDALDPGRSIFVQSDIEQFEQLRERFDDFIRENAVQPAFVMFSILRMRVEERVKFALARLEEPFDFKRKEEYRFNRKDADWAEDVAALDDLWRKRIKNDILDLRLSGKDEEEVMTTLRKRYTHLARRTRQFKSEDVFQVFINAYVGAIDPHSTYFAPRASENFKINMRLSLEGIGAVLQTDNEYTQIRRIIPGGPAELGGELQAEDRIVGVAQGEGPMVDVIGWRLDDVVQLIRGPKNSIVRLEVLPGSDGPGRPTKTISIRRDEINLEEQAAKKRVLQLETRQGTSTIGVIDLPSFYTDFDGQNSGKPDFRSTTRDVRKLLGELAEEGIDGLVIDLRGNGGGALGEAVSLTGLFIEKGPVVQIRNAKGEIGVKRDGDSSIVYTGPLVVLVDRYSASASEIFAGAIQDYGRGLIIGEPTFGKGTVQHVLNLGAGQLKLTVAQFFRITGESTQYRGVVPDIIWPSATDSDEFGERTYENAIPWRRIRRAGFQQFQPMPSASVVARLRDLHVRRTEDDPEFQHIAAVNEVNAKLRERESITVNERKRKRERKKYDGERLELENDLRRALGKKLFASIDELDDENEERNKPENRDKQPPGARLREGGNIVSDYRYLMGIGLADGERKFGDLPGDGKSEQLVGSDISEDAGDGVGGEN